MSVYSYLLVLAGAFSGKIMIKMMMTMMMLIIINFYS